MKEGKEKKAIAIKEGVYELPAGDREGHLLGTRCKDCGGCFYPQRKNCLRCYSENTEKAALSKKGKIFRYTIIRQNYPGSVLTPPYVTAQIKLPEEVYITTVLTGLEFKDVRIGMEVESYFFTLKEDDEKKVIIFAFRPVLT